MITRPLEENDIPFAKAVWKSDFDDSDSFISWFFHNRIKDGYSVCTEADGKIVSLMHAYPYVLKIRSRSVSSAVISGVSTVRSMRKRGLMKQLMCFEMNNLSQKGISCVFYRPLNPDVYTGMGHACYSRTALIEGISDTPQKCIFCTDYLKLYNIYNAFSLRYSGIINRSLDDFKLKMQDYLSDNAKIIVDRNNGYAVFYETENKILSPEFVYISRADKLFNMLSDLSKQVEIKTAPDCAFKNKHITEQEFMGICDISLYLKQAVNINDYSININDCFLDKNNGCFTLSGKKTSKKPQLEMNISDFIKLSTGSKTLNELNIRIYDKSACVEINEIFSKQVCYIIDEY